MFEFDTGTADAPGNPYRFDRAQGLIDGVMDSLGDAPTDAQIIDATVRAILGELRKPKKLATVRQAFLRFWPILAPLAHTAPAQFDAVLMEYAELTTVRPE